MADAQAEKDRGVVVSIFGRDVTITAEQLDTTMTVLAMLTGHEPFQAPEQDALWAARDLVSEARKPVTPPVTATGGA